MTTEFKWVNERASPVPGAATRGPGWFRAYLRGSHPAWMGNRYAWKGLRATAFTVCCLLGAALGARAGEQAGGKASPERAGSPLAVEKGILKNRTHAFHFPILEGWSLAEGATPEEMNFSAEGCEDCALRVMVSPGNTLPLMETVQAIREQILKSAGARIAGEEPVKVAREDAYTIVKEEPKGTAAPEGAAKAPVPDPAEAVAKPPAAAPRVLIKTRYVTFSHGADKFYILLRAPKGRFGGDDAAFEKLLAKFRFELGS